MIDYTQAKIKSIFIHYCGNKANEDPLTISKKSTEVTEDVGALLSDYFLKSFKSSSYMVFHHHSELMLNEMYAYSTKIFADPDSLYVNSIHVAQHLYEQSTHPNIKAGELYVVYFENCTVDEVEGIDAIGIFKSENKDTFLKVRPTEDSFVVDADTGLNLHKLDKGCIVFDCDQEQGYKLCVIENTNKGEEARYWKDDFLHVKPRNDSFHYTKNYLDLCKTFVTDKLPEEFELSKTDQIDLLNRSVNFFKKKEQFDFNEFTEEVIQQPDLIHSFKDYKTQFQNETHLPIVDEFDISTQAVKKQAKIFKSILKLDKNFHIYIHGNKDLIEKGVDENSGMNFYKIYFKEEA